MPRLERDGLVAETRHDGIALEGRVKGNMLRLSVEDMRWLLTMALPTLLNALDGQAWDALP
jgi:hypothetical protein